MIFPRVTEIALTAAAFLCAAALSAAQPANLASGAAPVQGCVLPAKRLQRLELIFGLSGKNGPVTPRAWAAFIGREVTPRFPGGFTVFDGHGQWRSPSGHIGKEPSRLLLIWYEPDISSDAKIEAIRTAYKKRFHQESVLRADDSSCVSF